MPTSRTKPLLGAQVNWGHYFAHDLAQRYLFNERSARPVGLINRVVANPKTSEARTVASHEDNGSMRFGVSGSDGYLDAGTDRSTQDLALNTPMTILARIKPPSSSPAGGIAERSDGNTVNAGWIFGVSGTGLGCKVVNSVGDLSLVAASVLTSGVWQWVALTLNGGNTAVGVGNAIYVNGVSVTLTTTTNGSGTRGSDASRSLLIGFNSFTYTSGAGNNVAFNGSISDIAFYRRAFSAADVQNYIESPYEMLGVPQAKTWVFAAAVGLPILVTGDVTIGGPSVTGTATVSTDSAGDVTIGGPSVDATSGVVSEGDVTIGGPSVTGTATVSTDSTGDVTIGGPSTTGSALPVPVPLYTMELLSYAFVDLDDPVRKEGRATNFGDIHVGMSDSQGTMSAGSASLTINDLNDRPIATRLGTAGQGYFDGDQIEIFAISDKGRKTSATPNRLARVLLDEDSYEDTAEVKFKGTDPFFAGNTSLFSPDSKFPYIQYPRYYLNAPEDIFSKYIPVIIGEVSDAGAKDPLTGRVTPKGKCPAYYMGMDGLPTGPGGSAEQWGRFNACLFAIYKISGLFGSDLGGNLYGSTSATSNGASPSVITLSTSSDLSSVARDGSVTMTIFTAKGRVASKITAINGKQVTIDNTIDAVDATNVDWIIGETTPDRVEIDIASRNGVDVMVPGYANYVRSTPYEDLLFEGEQIRVTDFWVRGPLLAEHLSGTVTITFNAIGIEDKGDGSGLPITDYFTAEYWWWINCAIAHTRSPGGTGFEGLWPQTDGDVAAIGGAWSDGVYKVNGQSFVDAQTWSKTLRPDGFKISAYFGGDSAMGMRDVGQLFNNNAGGPIVRTGINEHGQIFKWFLDIYADTSTWQVIHANERIFGKTKRWNAKSEIENVTTGVCDWDPEEQKYRRGVVKITSDSGILHAKNVRKPSLQIEGKLVADLDQFTAMLTARNNFTKDGPNYVSINGGDAGLWDCKIGSGILYTDQALALVDEPLVIIDKIFRLSTMQIDMICIDVGSGPVVNGSNSGVSVIVPMGQRFLVTDDVGTAPVVSDDSAIAPRVYN